MSEPASNRLLDALRAGQAPDAIRRKGARGELPVAVGEKVEILVFLTGDADQEVRRTALETLHNLPSDELAQAVRDVATPGAVLEFISNDLLAAREDLRELLARESASENVALEPRVAPGPEPETLLQRVTRMSVDQKIRAALLGTRAERLLLVRDPNKSVACAVLHSPRLSEVEVEAFAAMKTVTEEVLRLIAVNRAFMRHYPVVLALANNPRAPIDITLPLINRLNERDLKALSVNKNVPDVLRKMAARRVAEKQHGD